MSTNIQIGTPPHTLSLVYLLVQRALSFPKLGSQKETIWISSQEMFSFHTAILSVNGFVSLVNFLILSDLNVKLQRFRL